MCVVLLICLSLPGGGGTPGQSVKKLPAGQSVIQLPAGQSVLQLPAGQSVIQLPAGQPVLQLPVGQSVLQLPAGQSVIKLPVGQPVIKLPVGQPVIQLPVGQPVIQLPIGQSGVEASVHAGNRVHSQGPAREGSNEYRIPQFGQGTLTEAGNFPVDHKLRGKRTTRACPPGCSSCSAVNGCVTCERRYFMFLYRRRMRQTGMCATSCPPGYYGVRYRQYSKCNKCQIAACETCLSRHYCTRCFKPHVSHGGGCVISCPPGSVLDERREACVESVDCKVGTWGAWSTCRSRGRVCARRGVKTRSRPVLQTPSPGNVVCPDLQERRRCKVPCKDGCRHRKRGKRKRKRGRTRKRKKHRRRGRSKKRKSPKRRCRNGLRQRCRRTRRC